MKTMFSDINVKMVKAPQCSERRMGGCLAVPGPEVGRCVRAGVRLLSSLSRGHIPSVATRHRPLPGYIGDSPVVHDGIIL